MIMDVFETTTTTTTTTITTKRSITFRFKDYISNFHMLYLISFILGSSLDPITVKVLDTFNLRIGEHMTTPPLPKKGQCK